MENITKIVFNPLLSSKAAIVAFLKDASIGTAHAYSPKKLLLYKTKSNIQEIDISKYDESHFFNAVDLDRLSNTLQERMERFGTELQLFNDEYTVQQAPSAVFKVPIEPLKPAILAVSQMHPSYYDLCVADESCNTVCFENMVNGRIPGLIHSGDIIERSNVVHHIRASETLFMESRGYAVFVSGYQTTQLWKFKECNPVVMIANHADKVLYTVPIPLDTATIGNATICSPLVIKRERDELICSILATPTTDVDMCCQAHSLDSPSFAEAICRAEWKISAPTTATSTVPAADRMFPTPLIGNSQASFKENVIFVTEKTRLRSPINNSNTQLIRYGKGLDFLRKNEKFRISDVYSDVVLPCVLGSQLEGPLLLATGTVPEKMPFPDTQSLHDYYNQLKSVVIFADERMTDNARNLAPPLRINAVFVIQPDPQLEGSDVVRSLELVNINAVTALAGPQSLVLVENMEKYYFYRGLADPSHLDTSKLSFGAEVTAVVESVGLQSLLDPRVKRIVNLAEVKVALLQSSGQWVQPKILKALFQNTAIDQIGQFGADISAVVPQLQVLMNQKDLVNLSRDLVSILGVKFGNFVSPLRNKYVNYLLEHDRDDPESVKVKNTMLSDLRRLSKGIQKTLEPVISFLSNMISAQTSSKRAHDLQRLRRQAAIQSNVDLVKSMTFETMAGLLETKASEMGTLLLNIETLPYQQLLRRLKTESLDAFPCCALDSRVLFLEGIDAGIVMEQSQAHHEGPLKHQLGPSHPILAIPYLSKDRGTGSMLAWVCWDEFVNLKSPFKVRWMEKSNESHIAAFRIIMRNTLSQAVSSREHNLRPGDKETGQLYCALLMAAMARLASMRTTAPTRTVNAEDSVTKLMRGLFGNLLTTAGSGVQPMSMVWQLFGLEPRLEVPQCPVAWSWYEKVVALYPYSGWPLGSFHANLEKLLDKVIIAVVTKNEDQTNLKAIRTQELVNYCKLRNIQLVHSRTVITIFMRMMQDGVDRKAVATRLLAVLPLHLEKQTESYRRVIRYLAHLSQTGVRREHDDFVAVSIYLKRSAVFKDLKQAVANACKLPDSDDATIKTSCVALMSMFAEIVNSWHLPNSKLTLQNGKAYQGLLDSHPEEGVEQDETTKSQRRGFVKQVLSDAENSRVPWHVVLTKGDFGDEIEPLDEAFCHEIMTGKRKAPCVLEKPSSSSPHAEISSVMEVATPAQRFAFSHFSALIKPSFISEMDSLTTAEDVCRILDIPLSTMQVFATALNPGFDVGGELGENFREVVAGLLRNRMQREKSGAGRRLVGLGLRLGEEV